MICICCIDDSEKQKALEGKLDFLTDKVKITGFPENKAFSFPSEAVYVYVLTKHTQIDIPAKSHCSVIMPFELISSSRFDILSGIPLITYGISPKATVSYSSNSSDGLLISLQRSIKAFSGKIIEPHELIFSGYEQTETDIGLIAASIYLLLL